MATDYKHAVYAFTRNYASSLAREGQELATIAYQLVRRYPKLDNRTIFDIACWAYDRETARVEAIAQELNR